MTNHISRLAVLGARRKELEADLDRIRPELIKLIRVAAEEGMRQIEIVNATGYTREMVRRIVAGRTS